jgi:hypothetical protein
VLKTESTARTYSSLSPKPFMTRDELLRTVRHLYRQHGIAALATPFLEKQRFSFYQRLLAAGLKQPVLLAELGLADEYRTWKNAHRAYRGDIKPIWTWDTAVVRARAVLEQMGRLPTVEWFRTNGLSALTTAVHNSGRNWEDLRKELGLPPRQKFCESRNGKRWLSQPEALFSDYLDKRGIEHKRGERYPDDFKKKTGAKWARYDAHFRAADGRWINVEIWGETKDGTTLSGISRGRYRRSKARKESWLNGNTDFLGVSYKDCYAQKGLERILAPYIGNAVLAASANKPEIDLEQSLYADKAELLEKCRKLAASMPDGIFPSESWIRKRGKHRDRPGEADNTLAAYVFRWLGGTRRVRELLGQGDASTIKWSEAKVREAWSAFEAKTGLTPSQAKGKNRIAELPRDIVNEAGRIYRVAHDLGLLADLRNGRKRSRWSNHTRLAA